MQVNFKYELGAEVTINGSGVRARIEAAYIGFRNPEPQYYVRYYDTQNIRQTNYIDESDLTLI